MRKWLSRPKPWLPHFPPLAALALVIIVSASLLASERTIPDAIVKYQTLFSALLALTGGALAYRGAVAKVEFDRELARQARLSQQLGVVLRFRAAIIPVRVQTEYLAEYLDGLKSQSTFKVPKKLLNVPTPPELEEAWNKIELLPIGIEFNIDEIRKSLAKVARTFGELPEEKEVGHLNVYALECELIAGSCKSLLAALNEEVKRIRESASN